MDIVKVESQNEIEKEVEALRGKHAFIGLSVAPEHTSKIKKGLEKFSIEV